MTIRLSERIPSDLPEDVRETLRKYVKEVTNVFGSALEGVILYGSAARGEFLEGRSNLNLVFLLGQHDLNLLQRYAKTHRRWVSGKLVVPLFLTANEIENSQKFFPLEYVEIQESHVLLVGHDPFSSLRIDRGNLAAQCGQEIMGNLMRLRQRFVEGAGKSEALAILLPLSLTTLLPSLRGQYRMRELQMPPSTDALLKDLPARFGIDATVLQEVWNLKRGVVTPGPVEMPRLFERYVACLQTLSEWSSHPSSAKQP
jgi:hypothetical protein